MAKRFLYGLGAVTNMSDGYPWGLWIVYDVFFVPFSAGAFMILAITHIYNRREYHPIARPVVLAGFLGEVMVIAVLVMDLEGAYVETHATPYLSRLMGSPERPLIHLLSELAKALLTQALSQLEQMIRDAAGEAGVQRIENMLQLGFFTMLYRMLGGWYRGGLGYTVV